MFGSLVSKERAIEQKVVAAQVAIKNGRCAFGPNQKNIFKELSDLNIGSAAETWPLLLELLEEVSSKDHVENELPIVSVQSPGGSEIFVFLWQSQRLKNRVRLEFSLLNENFCYHSIEIMKK